MPNSNTIRAIRENIRRLFSVKKGSLILYPKLVFGSGAFLIFSLSSFIADVPTSKFTRVVT